MVGEETKTAGNGTTVFICITCTGSDSGEEPPAGRALFDAVAARVHEQNETGITVAPVACLSACKRPCTVALAGTGKWTSVVGDLDPELHADDVVAAARSHQASESGIIPWRERPLSFRKGVVSRTPPVGFRLEPGDP